MRLAQLAIALSYENTTAKVYFAFGYFFPTGLSSYRGDYSQLAVNYTDPETALKLFYARQENFDKGNWGTADPPKLEEPRTVEWWTERLNRADGESFEGYKGGHYQMHSHTKMWAAASSGEYTHALVVRVTSDHSDRVYFETVYGGHH